MLFIHQTLTDLVLRNNVFLILYDALTLSAEDSKML